MLAAGFLIKHIVEDALKGHNMAASLKARREGVASAVPVRVGKRYYVIVVIPPKLDLAGLEVNSVLFVFVAFGLFDLSD